MHILVLQHERVEHPGIFRRFLDEDGHSWDTVELDAGDALPDLDEYDALWVLGGPMDVWQEDAHPWLKEEKAFIRDAVVDRGMPYLGLCLGHQLLAEALGGTVGPSETPEIGVKDVQLTEAGASGVLFDGVPEKFDCLQWHSAEIKSLPEGIQVLATSPACPVQAMKWQTRAFGLQFHVEIESDTVRDWQAVEAYAEALEKALGSHALKDLENACAARMEDFNALAERLYINWLQATART